MCVKERTAARNACHDYACIKRLECREKGESARDWKGWVRNFLCLWPFSLFVQHTHTRSCHSSFDQNASFQVEKELKRLLRADLEADSVRWEIVTADEKKKVS